MFGSCLPNGHGITVLMALQILKDMKLGERDCVDTMHKQIEAMKLAMVDTAQYVAEPSYMKVSVDQLLSEKYAAKRRALINNQAIMPEPGEPGCPSTVYFCCADGERQYGQLHSVQFPRVRIRPLSFPALVFL